MIAKAAGATKVSVISSFVLNLLLGFSLQQLLCAMKKFQIMVHLLIANVNFPANAQLFFSSLLSLVNFNLIDVESLLRKTLNLYDSEIVLLNFN